MIGALLAPAVVPFTGALAVLAALLVSEIVLHLVGLSALGAEDGVETEAPDSGSAGSLLSFLGLTEAPALVWIAALLAAFGLSGHLVQAGAVAVLERPLPVVPVVLGSLALGIAFARSYARLLADLVPRVETAATDVQFLGGLAGVVSQGTARAASPAEVRLRDRHGNVHHLRCEPLDPGDVIPEGTAVVTVRRRDPAQPGGWVLRIVAAERPRVSQATPETDP